MLVQRFKLVQLSIMGILVFGLAVLACTKTVEVPVEVIKEVLVEAPELGLLERAKAEGLRVGFVQEDPFGFINEAGECTGFDIEVTREAASRAGIIDLEAGEDIICVHLAWPGLVAGLLADRIDLIPVGMSIQPKRCEVAAFSDPYQTYGTGAMVKPGNPKNFRSIQDLAERDDIIVALAIGTPIVEVMEEMGVSEDNYLLFPEQIQQLDAVKTGRADALITNSTFINRYLFKEGTSELERALPFDYPKAYNSGHVFRPSDRDSGFVDMWNGILREMKLDGKMAEIGEGYGWTEDDLLGPDASADGCCSGEFTDNVGCKAVE